MKRLTLTFGIAAVATAAAFLGVNAANQGAGMFGLPYDQSEVDRALPNLPERADQIELDRAQLPEETKGIKRGAPHDPLAQDRALPDVSGRAGTDEDASAGGSAAGTSAWDKDYHFIAPAQ